MDNDVLFPHYIRRDEERAIHDEVALVRADRASRAILLYGRGGIGKTSLVRELARANAADRDTIWVDPIDVDDSQYWLLSNLEQQVARRLDPAREFFGPYFDYLSRLPAYTRPDIGHETVVSHLGRIKRVFARCYTTFVQARGATVVITFDTVETIRGMYLLLTLTQWMKALPATLFVLSGRPPADDADEADPILAELGDPHKLLPARIVWLTEFTRQHARDYIDDSGVSGHVSDEEKEKLVLLARGHPLWLAFAVSYLDEKGLPEEAAGERAQIEREVPYGETMTNAGQHRHEEFKRRLMTPYRQADFWHEGVKRLAVVRLSVSKDIWMRLMADCRLPAGAADLSETWEQLLRTPWIRPRANRQFVTLHDAVAEELAQRIIPVHDESGQWRRDLWRRAAVIYDHLTDGPDVALKAEFAALDRGLKDLAARWREGDERSRTDESQLVRRVSEVDSRKRRLDQLKAAGLFYQLLCDFESGCLRFLGLFGQAKAGHDVLFEDLLALEMQRFLPGGSHAHALGDVIGDVVDRFRGWLTGERPDLYLQIGLSVADYLISEEQPRSALELLDQLDQLDAEPAGSEQRYHALILRGNCHMRIPGQVTRGLQDFQRALEEARRSEAADRPIRLARAYKELGFYYRNCGRWADADQAYEDARDAISPMMSLDSPPEYREEMASIQTNWGYVKGLVGQYRDGTNLVEAAINVRRRLDKRQELATSLSTCGEVYRYERRFERAWDAFSQAEQIFHELQNWAWLGLIYQEQAICLYQAWQDGINLVESKERSPIERARRLALVALDICRDQAVRGYPSALNRAGRIFGADDAEVGLGYLADGIDVAGALSDGWFLFGNLIEYAELCYRTWVRTGERGQFERIYLERIAERAPDILRAIDDYQFPDLEGRWNLLQGHLNIWRWRDDGDESRLGEALENYKTGFSLIAQGYVGSSGAAAVPAEFETFRELFQRLPDEIRADWQRQLRDEWGKLKQGSTLLLARLEELY